MTGHRQGREGDLEGIGQRGAWFVPRGLLPSSGMHTTMLDTG